MEPCSLTSSLCLDVKCTKSRQLILSKGFDIMCIAEKWLKDITCTNEAFLVQVYRRNLGGTVGDRVVGVSDAVKSCLFICGNSVN